MFVIKDSSLSLNYIAMNVTETFCIIVSNTQCFKIKSELRLF